MRTLRAVLPTIALLAVIASPAAAAVDAVAPIRADNLTGGQSFMDPAGVTHVAAILHGPEARSGQAVRQRRCVIYGENSSGAFSFDTVGCYTEQGTGSLRGAQAPAIAVRFGRPFIAWARTGSGGVAISKRDRGGGPWRTDSVRGLKIPSGTPEASRPFDAGLQVNVEANRARVSWSRCDPGNPPICRVAYAVRSDGARFRIRTVDSGAGPATQLALGRLPYVLYRAAGRGGESRELRLARITRTGARIAAVAPNAVAGFDLVNAPEGIVVAYQRGGNNRRLRLLAGAAHGPFAPLSPNLRIAPGPIELVRTAVAGAPARFVVSHTSRPLQGGSGLRPPALSAFAEGSWTTRPVQQQNAEAFRGLGLAASDAANRMSLTGSCRAPGPGTGPGMVCAGVGDAGF